MDIRKSVLALGIVWAAVGLINPTPLQAQATTGNIQGQVLDEKGEALPGVLVAARSPQTGVERGVTTDKEGKFTLLGLPPDSYLVRASLTGYGALPQETTVDIGQTVPLDFKMQPVSGLVERVKVANEPPLLNTTKSEINTVVTEQQIRSYPLLNREFSDLAVLAPGVRQAPTGQFDTTKKQGVFTPFTTGGSTGSNLNLSVDGTDNNDKLVGFYLQGFPADGIGEFEVIQDMPTAEYGRTSGAVINVVTKSGTNDFSGSLFGVFRNQNTRATSLSEEISGAEKQESTRGQYGISFGGPILKDRLFYYVAVERQDDTTPIGLNPVVTQYAGTEPPGFPIPIATPGTSFTQDFERNLWSVKLNWNPSSNHLLWARYSQDDFDSLNDQGTALTDPSINGNTILRSKSVALSWQWFMGGRVLNELKMSRIDNSNSVESTSPAPILLASDNFFLGQNTSTPLLDEQKTAHFRDDLSWLAGRHSFRTGLEAIPVDIRFGQDFTETLPVLVFNPGIVPADTMVHGDTGTGNATLINGVDDGIDILRGVGLSTQYVLEGTYTQWGAYFQDDWDVSDRWRLHLGLRADIERGIWASHEGANKAFYECLADPSDNIKCGRDPATINPPQGVPDFHRTFPQDPWGISPRLGFVYRVHGGETDTLRGSWGLFYDQTIGNIAALAGWYNKCPDCFPTVHFLLGCPFDLSTCAGSTKLTAGSIVHPDLPPLPVDFTLFNWVNDPSLRAWLRQLELDSRGATFDDNVGFGLISPDYRASYTSAFSLGWGHVLTPNLVLDTNFIYRRGYHQYRAETLAGFNSGRQIPWPAVTDPSTGVATYRGVMSISTSDGESEFYSFQLGFKGRYPRLDFGASLNFSEARGTQDNGGTGSVNSDGGSPQMWDGGNIQFTGGSIDSEWGRISGDQRIYTFLFGTYLFPRGFQTSAQIGYGCRVAVHPFAGEDLNGDGFSDNEYSGARGGGLGGDFFNINLRLSKLFDTGKGTALEAYLDIFNLTNHDNYGTLVIHRQLIFDGSAIQPNPDYLNPIGNTLTPPRTLQLGMRFYF